MKKNITLLALHFTLFALVQHTAFAGTNGKAQAVAKKQQASELKTKCPHYPAVQASATGAAKNNAVLFDSWKKSYPEEYKAYQKIFNYTNK